MGSFNFYSNFIESFSDDNNLSLEFVVFQNMECIF